ncbi:MAG: DUF885 domain-containing protein [Kofleriaceae bacterium]
MADASPLAADAIAGATDPSLIAILADHWEWLMRWSPTWATTLGDHRYDDQLPKRDELSIARYTAERDALIARLLLCQPTGTDGVTRDLLLGHLEAQQGTDVMRSHEWAVDAYVSSPLSELSNVVEAHVVKTPHDADQLVARMGQGARLVGEAVANLRRGLARGLVASKEQLRRAVAQLDGELAKPYAEWAIGSPRWAEQFPDHARKLRTILETEIAPAIRELASVYRDELMPAGRGDVEGLAGLPDGDAMYRAAIRFHVGLQLDPRDIHELGKREIAETDRQLAELGARVLGTTNLADTIHRLRTDPKLYFTTREELMAAAQDCLDRANAAAPRFFSVLPKTPCVMRETPAYAAPFSTVAHYQQPHYDGSKPGEYFVNTYKPETRSRFELEALSWHEAVPGHHTQIAIAMELGALPAFRKLDGSTAFVEGWALYTERLADEMGLYSSDLDRLGKLSFDAWRGSRLVVDTGVHHFGWTRAQAEAYMHEHTALTPINISNEVDRYIGWPGQALAYKIGQLEILKLRAEAEQQPHWDLKTFHQIVLGAGAVTLPVLRARVTAWQS